MTERILVTGGTGFLGQHVCSLLQEQGHAPIALGSEACDLTDQRQTKLMVKRYRPTHVIHLAAKVGGIGANQVNPGLFGWANLAMGVNLIEAVRGGRNFRRFVLIGTTCSYPCVPKTIPFIEAELYAGYPEPTNASYGIAKRTLIELVYAYWTQYQFPGVCLIPANLYGIGDRSDHVIPDLFRKFKAAKAAGTEVTCWGDGSPTREFLWAADAADAIVKALWAPDLGPSPLNLGTGEEVSIRDLTTLIAELVGYEGKINWDHTRPNGQPRRCLNVSRAKQALGWEAKTSLREGLGLLAQVPESRKFE